MRKLLAFVVSAAVAMLSLTTVPASASNDAGSVTPPTSSGGDRSTDPPVFVTAQVAADQVEELRMAGFEIIEARAGATRGTVDVDLIANGYGLDVLDRIGATYQINTPSAAAARRSLTAGYNVWRSWSEPGGLADEMRTIAAANPDITELVKFGQSVQGQDLLAMKVSKDAKRGRNRRKPTVMYISAQHAREWITPEVTRRLLHHFVDNYGNDPAVTKLVDENELWFVLVANPDGYDYTFTEGNRLWRKNLADNDGDGQITGFDGVDLNRNWPFRWGWDNEGSSPDPTSETYRGPSAGSEPETRALDQFVRKLKPDFFVNYHSAAELLLYGNGWQVATPEPDDNIAVALMGDDANPAVPGYDPDISAELYQTNGETTNHLGAEYGVLAYTPELDTCDSAEALLPDDDFGPGYCASEGRSVFEFPDDEALVQLVFEKNLPLALSFAQSANDPANPVSSLGLTPPDFVVDSFAVSHDDKQEVAVEMRRSFQRARLNYQVNGGRTRSAPLKKWRGGEVYGQNGNSYYAEFRGEIRNTRAGDQVTVWFSGRNEARKTVTSEPFTYTVATTRPADVLVIANEDYLGFNPTQPGVVSPVYADLYVDAIEASGRSADVWDVTAQGVPHPLGVLSHYDTVVWELGDNRLTQEADDVLTDTPFGPLPDLSVAETQQYLTIAVRDYLNEGGKLFQSGEYVAFFGFFGGPLGGAYYGLNGDPSGDCVVTEDFFADCLIYSDDFAQYYQGVYLRSSFGAPAVVAGVGGGLDGTYAVDGAETPNSGGFTVTSDELPVSEFPQFASEAALGYEFNGPPPFGPFGGDYYAAAVHVDDGWQRLTQVIDLTGATAAELAFKLSYQIETGYDHVIVEARPVGGTSYTTLPDLNGGSSSQVPAECDAGFLLALHPDLSNYLTLDATGCSPTGATGQWNSFTGDSGGWTDARIDLSGYAGQAVEVSISYVTDPATGGVGVFVDDATVTIDGTSTIADFETDLGPWTVPGAPSSSPGNGSDWIRSIALFEPPSAGVATDDTITFGFGFEAIATPEERATLMGQILQHLKPRRR